MKFTPSLNLLGSILLVSSCALEHKTTFDDDDPKLIPIRNKSSSDSLAEFASKDMVSEADIDNAFVFKTAFLEITVGSNNGVVSGGLTKLEILSVIKKYLPALGVCFKNEIDYQETDKTCNIDAKFSITAEGDTLIEELTNPEKCSETFTSCVSYELKKMKFPKPRGGTPVEVTYPFSFKPL